MYHVWCVHLHMGYKPRKEKNCSRSSAHTIYREKKRAKEENEKKSNECIETSKCRCQMGQYRPHRTRVAANWKQIDNWIIEWKEAKLLVSRPRKNRMNISKRSDSSQPNN